MQIRITFYIQGQTCSGNIDLHDEERLLDFLNSRSDTSPEDNDGFLRISEMTMTLIDKSKDRIPEASIKKSAIKLLAIQEEDLARGLGAKPGPKSYPFVEKSPIPVKLHLQDCSIIGNMHCIASQDAYDLLEEPLSFIPITQARILTPDLSSWWKAPFVAVNRNQITIFSKEGLQS